MATHVVFPFLLRQVFRRMVICCLPTRDEEGLTRCLVFPVGATLRMKGAGNVPHRPSSPAATCGHLLCFCLLSFANLSQAGFVDPPRQIRRQRLTLLSRRVRVASP